MGGGNSNSSSFNSPSSSSSSSGISASISNLSYGAYTPSSVAATVKSIPSRFMNQDIMRDAASFLSQRLPGLTGGGGGGRSSSGSGHVGPSGNYRPMAAAAAVGSSPGYLKTPYGRQDR